LIIAIAIAGLIFGEEAARGEVSEQLEFYVGPASAQAIQGLVEQAAQPGAGTWAAVICIGTLLFGALAMFVQLKTALDRIWKLEAGQPRGVWGLLWTYLFALVMVLSMGFLLLASLSASAVMAVVVDLAKSAHFSVTLPGGIGLWQSLEVLLSLALLTLAFAVTFRFMSEQRIAWRDIWGGALLTALLFTIGKTLLGLYLGWSRTASAYGAAGSLVAFLIWVYYSAQILFFGAEWIGVRRQRQAVTTPRAEPSKLATTSAR
jgi:membrane protein